MNFVDGADEDVIIMIVFVTGVEWPSRSPICLSLSAIANDSWVYSALTCHSEQSSVYPGT